MSVPAPVKLTAPRLLLNAWMAGERFHRFARGFEVRLAHERAEAHLDNLANPSVKALVIAAMLTHFQRPLVVVCPDPQVAAKYEFELNRFLTEPMERCPRDRCR